MEKTTWQAEREQAKRASRRDANGFFKRAAYLGGHPVAAASGTGHLALAEGNLIWVGQSRAGSLQLRKQRQRFSIPLESVSAVEAKSEGELRKAPKGYVAWLPVAWAAGYGGKMKHPLNPSAKLTALLVVNFSDEFGDAQRAVFANHPSFFGLTSSMQELANKVVAGRYALRKAVAPGLPDG